jgi:hypothetical protein
MRDGGARVLAEFGAPEFEEEIGGAVDDLGRLEEVERAVAHAGDARGGNSPVSTPSGPCYCQRPLIGRHALGPLQAGKKKRRNEATTRGKPSRDALTYDLIISTTRDDD